MQGLQGHSEARLADGVVARSAPPTRMIAWGGGRAAGGGLPAVWACAGAAALCAGAVGSARLPLGVVYRGGGSEVGNSFLDDRSEAGRRRLRDGSG